MVLIWEDTKFYQGKAELEDIVGWLIDDNLRPNLLFKNRTESDETITMLGIPLELNSILQPNFIKEIEMEGDDYTRFGVRYFLGYTGVFVILAACGIIAWFTYLVSCFACCCCCTPQGHSDPSLIECIFFLFGFILMFGPILILFYSVSGLDYLFHVSLNAEAAFKYVKSSARTMGKQLQTVLHKFPNILSDFTSIFHSSLQNLTFILQPLEDPLIPNLLIIQAEVKDVIVVRVEDINNAVSNYKSKHDELIARLEGHDCDYFMTVLNDLFPCTLR